MSAVAFERQIRQIYDAIDSGSNKPAIVACNKLLKKDPKNDLVKALKSLALVRQQKVEESLVLCDEVLATKPTDDGVLSAMMHVLRALGRHSDMVVMFDDAYKKQPANQELACQAFFANVRVARWKFAQQIAAKMHKQFQEDRYLYWNIICTILQAKDTSTSPTMRPVLLKLAHRLVTSSPNASLQTSDRFFLHLSILRDLSLFDELRTLVESDAGKSICATSLYCDEIRRDMFKTNALWQEEGEHAKAAILANNRNWLEFLSVIDGVFSDVVANPVDGEARSACTSKVSEAKTFFSEISEKDGRRDRSGLLALIELESRARTHGLSTDPARLLSTVARYFEHFGDKASCFEDLMPYLTLSEEDRTSWVPFLSAIPEPVNTTDDLQRLINKHKIARYCLFPDEITISAEAERANTYIHDYLEYLPLGRELPSTELQPTDDLAILAANVLINLYTIDEHNEKWLWNVVTLLEYALTKSKQSGLMRLLLVRIYQILGAPSMALAHYRLVGIKQVQMDTLSHFVLPRCSSFSLSTTGDLSFMSECMEATQIYLSNTQETSEFVVRCFMGEKYTQIQDFIAFEKKLDNSLQRDVMRMEITRMRLGHESLSDDLLDMELIELKFIFERTHHDNRDMAILSNYQPKGSLSTEEQTRLFGKPFGYGYMRTFLKIYVRALQQSSNLDETVEDKLLIGDRPKLSDLDPEKNMTLKERLLNRSEKEQEELTLFEASFEKYADALAEWLEPLHDYIRPPPSVVLAEAAKITEKKTGKPLKGVEIPSQNGAMIANHKKDEEAPVISDPPSCAETFFDEMLSAFEVAKNKPSPSEALHIAVLVQEAFLLFVIETKRFLAGSVVKIYKLGKLVDSFKPIRAKAREAVENISKQLITMADGLDTVESRKQLVEDCVGSLSALDHDFILDVAKKVTSARKEVVFGIGKGMEKVLKSHK